MAAPTQYYVDPALDADVGDGSPGNPYGDLQFALDSVTRDATDGDQFNIKSGTDEILTTGLSLASYGTPAGGAPLILRGYTTVVNDGGEGGITGNGATTDLIATISNHTHVIDMHLHNCDGQAIYVGSHCAIVNCRIDNVKAALITNQYCDVRNCSLVNIVGTGSYDLIYFGNFSNLVDVFVEKSATANIAVYSTNGCSVRRCTFHLKVAGDCIQMAGSGINIEHNSIYGAGVSGSGIKSLNQDSGSCVNNLIEGFTSGTGIDFSANTKTVCTIAGNAVYNCATAYDLGTKAPYHAIPHDADNETLDASPFTKEGPLTYENRFNWFRPANIGNTRNGGWPPGYNSSKGAAQLWQATGRHLDKGAMQAIVELSNGGGGGSVLAVSNAGRFGVREF